MTFYARNRGVLGGSRLIVDAGFLRREAAALGLTVEEEHVTTTLLTRQIAYTVYGPFELVQAFRASLLMLNERRGPR